MALGPLDADATLVLSDGRATSDTVTVRVTDRPFVGDVAIRAVVSRRTSAGRPSRSRWASRRDCRAARRSSIRGRASTELAAMWRSRDGARHRRTSRPTVTVSGRLSEPASGRWTWIAASADGPVADVPAPLETRDSP